MKVKFKPVLVGARVPYDVWRKLDMLREKSGQTMSDVVIYCLTNYLQDVPCDTGNANRKNNNL